MSAEAPPPPHLTPRTALLGGLALLALVLAAKWPTLHEPPFWDGLSGQALPALELLDTGRLIGAEGNFGHPPLLKVVLAFAWAVFGASLPVAHGVMVLCAALALFFTALVARRAFGPRAAVAAPLLTLGHSLFFAQAGLVNDAMPLAACTMATVWAFVARQWAGFAVAAVLLVWTKETGALLVALLGAAQVVDALRAGGSPGAREASRDARGALLAGTVAAAALGAWYLVQHRALGTALRTELFVLDHETPARILDGLRRGLLSDRTRLFTNGYNALLVGAAVLALRGLPAAGPGRRVVWLCLSAFTAYLVLFACTVELPRYYAPYVPLLGLAASAALAGPWETPARRRAAEALGVVAFVGLSAGDFKSARVGPGYELESNLDYQDMLAVHRQACAWLEAQAGGRVVRTWWPMTDELREPRLGYVQRAVPTAPPKGAGLYYLTAHTSQGAPAALPTPTRTLAAFERNGKRTTIVEVGGGELPPGRAAAVVQRAALVLWRRAPSPEEAARLQATLAAHGAVAMCEAAAAEPAHRAAWANAAPTELVDTLYGVVLGRAPDEGGRAATLDALARGQVARRLADMLDSAEFQALLQEASR